MSNVNYEIPKAYKGLIVAEFRKDIAGSDRYTVTSERVLGFSYDTDSSYDELRKFAQLHSETSFMLEPEFMGELCHEIDGYRALGLNYWEGWNLKKVTLDSSLRKGYESYINQEKEGFEPISLFGLYQLSHTIPSYVINSFQDIEDIDYAVNEEKNGVELRFSSKPSETVRTFLKEQWGLYFSSRNEDPRWYKSTRKDMDIQFHCLALSLTSYKPDPDFVKEYDLECEELDTTVEAVEVVTPKTESVIAYEVVETENGEVLEDKSSNDNDFELLANDLFSSMLGEVEETLNPTPIPEQEPEQEQEPEIIEASEIVISSQVLNSNNEDDNDQSIKPALVTVSTVTDHVNDMFSDYGSSSNFGNSSTVSNNGNYDDRLDLESIGQSLEDKGKEGSNTETSVMVDPKRDRLMTLLLTLDPYAIDDRTVNILIAALE